MTACVLCPGFVIVNGGAELDHVGGLTVQFLPAGWPGYFLWTSTTRWCHPPPLIFASRNGTAAIRQPRLSETLGVRYSRNATGGKSSNTVAATNIGDGSERPTHLTSRPVRVRLNRRLLHSSSRTRQWKRPSPARGAALQIFFVGGSGPARSAPPVRPSAQRFPRLRVPLRGAHINPCGPTGCRQALHQYQTQGDAHEATRSGIAWPGGRRKSLGRERSCFEAPGTGLPYAGPNPQDARTTGHLNTQPIEGDDS